MDFVHNDLSDRTKFHALAGVDIFSDGSKATPAGR
jgi:hypothetical protein